MALFKTDNQKLIKNLSIWGAIFVVIFGTVLHFFYNWSGENLIVGFFAPANESVWEHMKLVFTPMISFVFIDYFYLKSKVKNYCFALMKEIAVAIAFILLVYYIYTSVTGESILAIDISSFVIGIIIAKWFGYTILIGKFKNWEFKGINIISAIVLAAVATFFIVATINPPKISLFQDPITSTYGIYQK